MDRLHLLEALREGEDGIVLDVADIVLDCIICPFVGPEGLSALLADAEHVPTEGSDVNVLSKQAKEAMIAV